jgi:hypothetical protein
MAHRPSWKFLLAALGVTLVVFLAAYWESFRVRPASDDFSYINEIHRGRRDGVWALFARSVTAQTYRPMTSVGIWAFGNLSKNHRTEGVRVLHLLSAALYAAVALLWIRTTALGKCGAVVAIALMLLHPVLPQAVGSIDGFNSLVSSAFLWLGAWYVLEWRDRPVAALIAAAACFVAGTLFKEYAFALLPLSVLTVTCFWSRRRVAYAVAFAVAMGVLLVLAIAVRKFTVPPDPLAQGGWGYVAPDPLTLAKNVVRNAGLLAGGLLFFGNSIWAYVNQSPTTLTVVGVSVIAMIAFVTCGAALRLREPTEPAAGATPGDPTNSYPRWLVYLLFTFATASFPAVLTNRVSEMYVPPLVLPFALLCGFAADGFVRASVPVRALASTAAAVALVSSILTIRAKIDGLVDVGRRAERQIEQILSFLPPDATDKTVAVRYLLSDRRSRDLYAVFRMPDHLLLVHRNVLHWPRPYKGLVLDAETVQSFDELDPGRYDVALGWDSEKQQFFRLER